MSRKQSTPYRLILPTFTVTETCEANTPGATRRELVLPTGESDVYYYRPLDDEALHRYSYNLFPIVLNVGFSRARECMHFVLSKPITEYVGTIMMVLSHYQRILVDKSVPEQKDTDQSSPMEGKILDWIKQTPFYRTNRNHIELRAQFPVGEYLRQLDHTYHHPNWRVDFLLIYRHNNHDTKIIVEYDGFAEHFTEHSKVHEGNYESFYKPQDIERQLVIESYGYKFLRLNRFNLGNNPIDTISARLSALADTDQDARRSESQEKVKRAIKDIEEGDSKVCPRCNVVKPLEDFYDGRLKKGQGDIGTVCRRCKRLPSL